jgi:ABC-type spermidine/putrescine transport system permease subunit I
VSTIAHLWRPARGRVLRSAVKVVGGGLSPLVAFYLVVFFLPMALLVVESVRAGSVTGAEAESLVSIYHRIWTEEYYRSSAFYSFQVAFAATLVCLVMAPVLAHVIVRDGHRAVRLLTIFGVASPLFVSIVVRAFGLELTFEKFGISQSFAAVVIGMAQIFLPFAVAPLISGIRQLDWQTYAAARTLGASPTVATVRVLLPSLRPSFLAGGSMVFILSLNNFVIPGILGEPNRPTIAQIIYQDAAQLADFKTAAAIAISMLVITLLVMAPTTLSGEGE